jgi:hypothetical protein
MGDVEQSIKTASKKGDKLDFITVVPIFLCGNFGTKNKDCSKIQAAGIKILISIKGCKRVDKIKN